MSRSNVMKNILKKNWNIIRISTNNLIHENKWSSISIFYFIIFKKYVNFNYSKYFFVFLSLNFSSFSSLSVSPGIVSYLSSQTIFLVYYGALYQSAPSIHTPNQKFNFKKIYTFNKSLYPHKIQISSF